MAGASEGALHFDRDTIRVLLSQDRIEGRLGGLIGESGVSAGA